MAPIVYRQRIPSRRSRCTAHRCRRSSVGDDSRRAVTESDGACVKSGKGTERRKLAGLGSRCNVVAVRQLRRPRLDKFRRLPSRQRLAVELVTAPLSSQPEKPASMTRFRRWCRCAEAWNVARVGLSTSASNATNSALRGTQLGQMLAIQPQRSYNPNERYWCRKVFGNRALQRRHNASASLPN
jgi:hypothetical protein